MNKLQETLGIDNTIVSSLQSLQNEYKKFCYKCMKPQDPSCDICNGTGSFLIEILNVLSK